MENKIVNYFMGEFKGLNKYSDSDLRKMEYYLKCIYSVIEKLIVMVIINILLGSVWEMLLLILFYLPLRIFSFGFHTGTKIECWIASGVVYTVFPFLISRMFISTNIMLWLLIPITILTVLLSPADTKKRPIISKEKRLKNKIIIFFTSLIFLVAFPFIKNTIVLNSMFIAFLWNLICVSPILYILFKQPYNNYKSYL